jgi:hypothetical protein
MFEIVDILTQKRVLEVRVWTHLNAGECLLGGRHAGRMLQAELLTPLTELQDDTTLPRRDERSEKGSQTHVPST